MITRTSFCACVSDDGPAETEEDDEEEGDGHEGEQDEEVLEIEDEEDITPIKKFVFEWPSSVFNSKAIPHASGGGGMFIEVSALGDPHREGFKGWGLDCGLW